MRLGLASGEAAQPADPLKVLMTLRALEQELGKDGLQLPLLVFGEHRQ